MRITSLFASTVALVALPVACSSSPNNQGSGGAGSGTSTSSGVPVNAREPDFAPCGGAIFDATGKFDENEYRRQATLWDRATIDCRLGPTFDALHPGAKDDRPDLYEPMHSQNAGGYLCKTFELSGSCNGACDYGSTSGQVLYAGDDASDPGVDRVQTYGYESGHICESPVSGGWLGGPHPDPGIGQWSMEVGHPVRLPNGFSQSEMHETNAGIMIFPEGLVGATGNQTAGDTKPKTLLPPNKVPTSVAVTLYNEIALVTIWDTDALKGEVAVFALRAVEPKAFTVPYFTLPNEGGFTNIQLLGYVELPDMKTPTAISASGNNGSTPGGHVIGNDFGTKMDDPAVRMAFSRDDSERWVPTEGQAVVISRWEGKATFLDLTPFFQFVRKVYFGTDADWQQAKAQDVWPYSFDKNPEMAPTVVATVPIDKPTAVRIGNRADPNAKGFRQPFKAWIGDLSGTVHFFDVSGFAADARPVPAAGIKEIGNIKVGENITSMSLLGENTWNDDAVVACRGARDIEWIHAADDGVSVARKLSDVKLDDPVRVDQNDRGPVVTIADFHGKRLVTYRVGLTENNGGKPPANYGCGPNGADMTCANGERGGVLDMPGTPFFVGTTNVN